MALKLIIYINRDKARYCADYANISVLQRNVYNANQLNKLFLTVSSNKGSDKMMKVKKD